MTTATRTPTTTRAAPDAGHRDADRPVAHPRDAGHPDGRRPDADHRGRPDAGHPDGDRPDRRDADRAACRRKD
jgi:hypothetical protein